MSDAKESADSLSGEEQHLVEVLDRFVDALHAADFGSQSQTLESHPDLVPLLKCLNSIEALAPPSDAELETPAADDGRNRTRITPPGEPLSAEADARSSAAPVKGGDIFGKYQLLQEIGRGGMGVIYLAQQTELDRTVAIKMILSSRLASENDVRRFLAESRAAGRLTHPNIVRIYEAGEIHGQHYFAMEHIEGPSLSGWYQRSQGGPEEAAECMAAIARAVHYLHQQGIIHRDLKPSNILLDRNGDPHITDFGLARVLTGDGGHTQTGTIIGTPNYMPPEQAAGRLADISPRSDVYSLGAILYELLTGRPPYQHENPLDVLVDIIEGEPTLLTKLNPQVPYELDLICQKCLEKEPENRYESAEELAADLERYLRREPISARPRGILHRLRRWARREPALVSHLCGLLLAWMIVQGRYFYNEWIAGHDHDIAYYVRIIGVLFSWAATSFLFQRALNRERTAEIARYGWTAADCVFLTMALTLADGPRGLLLIGYPVLIAASGMFFRVRLVVFTTIVATLSFLVLMFIRSEEARPAHYPAIYAGALLVIGGVVAYQVYRVRVLSRYYDRKSVP